MTVDIQTSFVVHRGNSSAIVFPYDFQIPEAAAALVTIHNWASMERVQTLIPGEYSITGIGEEVGGAVTYNPGTPLSPDFAIVIARVVPYTQTLRLTNEGGFYPESLENQLDRIVMQIQQLKTDSDRTLRFPVGIESEGFQLNRPVPGQLLGWSPDGTKIIPTETANNERSLREAADKALASLIGQGGSVETQVYDTKTAAELSFVKETIDTIRTGGFSAGGDGGGALYRRVLVEPDHPGKFQTADGSWWELASTVLTPEMFGAQPSPADSRAAFNAAFEVLGVVASKLEAHSDYSFSGPVTATIRDDVEVDFTGAHFRPLFSDQQNLFDVNGLLAPTFMTTLTADAVAGDLRVPVASLDGITAGQAVQFYSREWFDPPGNGKRTYETNRVRGVEDIYVYLDAPLLADFTAAGDLSGGGDGTITLRFATIARNLKWTGGTYHCNHTVNRAISAQHLNDPIFSSLTLDKPGYYGLYVQDCCGALILDSYSYQHGRNILLNGSYNSGGGQAFGYGFITAHACFIRFVNCSGGRGWHTFDAADGTRDVTYVNCTTLSDTFGFSTHENCIYARYENCTSEGKHAFTHRARYIDIIGGVINGTSNHSLGLTSTVRRLIIKGTRFRGTPPITIHQSSSDHAKPVLYIITGCVFESNCGIGLGSAHPDSAILFANNEVFGSSVNGGQLSLGAGITYIKDNVFKDFVSSFLVIGPAQEGAPRKLYITGNIFTGSHLSTGETSTMQANEEGGVVELYIERNTFNARATRLFRWGNPGVTIKYFAGNTVGDTGPTRLVQFYLTATEGVIDVSANNLFLYEDWASSSSGLTITHEYNNFVLNQA